MLEPESLSALAGINYAIREFDPNKMDDWQRWQELFEYAATETGGPVGFDPDYNNYRELERMGNLVMVSARLPSGLLIGYTFHSIWNHYNCRTLRMAQRRSQYVVPQFRGQGIATKMLEMTHEELQRRGVKICLLNRRTFGRPRLDYKRLETVYYKEL
jgi:GNAT superfamily N-acetyltransferase